MSEFEPGQLDKLPKWVQGKVGNLQRRNDELQRKVAELEAAISGDGKSAFSIESGMDSVPLPSSARYLSWEAEDGFIIRLHDTDGELEVMCSSWHGVSIKPQASNVVRIGRGRTK